MGKVSRRTNKLLFLCILVLGLVLTISGVCVYAEEDPTALEDASNTESSVDEGPDIALPAEESIQEGSNDVRSDIALLTEDRLQEVTYKEGASEEDETAISTTDNNGITDNADILKENASEAGQGESADIEESELSEPSDAEELVRSDGADANELVQSEDIDTEESGQSDVAYTEEVARDDEALLADGSAVTPGIDRIFGDTAIETAMAIADKLKAELGVSKFENILVSRNDHYADAISGSYLAIKKNAPILLLKQENKEKDITTNNKVMNYVRANLMEGGLIYVLGGTAAVSEAVAERLAEIAEVKRLEGFDALGTNLAILREAGIEGNELVVATAKNYPDALSASALGKPIMIVKNKLTDDQKTFLNEYYLGIVPIVPDEPEETDPADDTKPIEGIDPTDDTKPIEEVDPADDTKPTEGADPADDTNPTEGTDNKEETIRDNDDTALKATGFTDPTKSPKDNRIYIMGGTGAVSTNLENELKSYGVTSRTSGTDMYDTAIAIRNKFFKATSEVALATGQSYHDALVGGAYAYRKKMPLLLTSKKASFQKAHKAISTDKNIKRITVFGGTGAVDNDAIGKKTDGSQRTGLLTVGGKKYYAYADGSFARKKSVASGKESYYFANDTVGLKNGLLYEDGKYKLITDGKFDTGVCRSYTWNSQKWNVIKGIATKVVTEKDKTLNNALVVVNKVTKSTMTMAQKLRACWNHIRTSYREYNPRIPHYTGVDWIIRYANDILVGGGGNCFSYGAAFAFMAKGIGYQNVYGCSSGGHGWAEIEGLVYDPEWSMHGKYRPDAYYGVDYNNNTVEVAYKAAIAARLPYMRVRI